MTISPTARQVSPLLAVDGLAKLLSDRLVRLELAAPLAAGPALAVLGAGPHNMDCPLQKMTLINSNCGATRYLCIKWP